MSIFRLDNVYESEVVEYRFKASAGTLTAMTSSGVELKESISVLESIVSAPLPDGDFDS